MKVCRFTIADALFERSPGQDGEVFAGDVVDARHGGPITIGYGRYGPGESIRETMAVDDVMIVLEGRLSVSTDAGTVTAGPGEIIYMPKGEAVVIRSHEEGAVEKLPDSAIANRVLSCLVSIVPVFLNIISIITRFFSRNLLI